MNLGYCETWLSLRQGVDFTLSPSVALSLSFNRKQCLVHISGQDVPVESSLTILWCKGSWGSLAVLMSSVTKNKLGVGLSCVCVFDSVQFPVYIFDMFTDYYVGLVT